MDDNSLVGADADESLDTVQDADNTGGESFYRFFVSFLGNGSLYKGCSSPFPILGPNSQKRVTCSMLHAFEKLVAREG